MALTAGCKLGPYEIVAQLGAGGMGEVYRARDPRLGRDVAVKILPPAFATDPARQARFEQEARAAAALNHPNIVGVFDIGAAEGSFYIVTELVPGETLAALIERGPLPVRKLLDIAAQVADGMSAAHAARITHRDLKPANIMIAEDGRAKILDFGLARQASAAAAAGPDATATIHQTSAGMIVGTVNYMSPEQATGREVDYRSDQFSFGLIVYEMASGKRAFERPESVQVMSAILTEEQPPLDAKVPAPLRWAIDRCLAKDPRDRYESTRDLYQDLRHLRDHLTEATLTSSAGIAPIAAPRRRAPWKIPAAFVAGILCTLAVMIWRAGPQASDQSTYRFTPFSFESGGQINPAWSPDGKAVAYSASRSREPYQVYLRYLDSPTPVQLTRFPDSSVVKNWSADGKHVLFMRPAVKPYGLWSVAAVGGDPEFSIALPGPSPIEALSRDNRVHVALHKGPDARYGLWYSTPPDAAEKKYSPDPFATPIAINNPQVGFSPDGKQILLYLNGARRREEAWLMPFPPDPSHPPRRIFTTIDTFNATPTFSWMPDNRHVVLALAPGEGATQLWMADTRSEERHALTSGTESRGAPAVSPDGSKLLFVQGIASADIVSVDLATAAAHPLIATERFEAMPAWAAKAPVMAYTTDRNGPTEIWLHDPANSERPLFASQASSRAANGNKWLMGPAPSPDGSRVIYTLIDHATGAFGLWIAAVSGGAPLRLTNDSSAIEEPGAWSPDGAWFVYQAIHNGKEDLMKVKASGEAAPSLLHADLHRTNAAVPCWSPTGEWIAYTDRGYKLISPDGAQTRDLGDIKAVAAGFSADGKLLYGIRVEGDHCPLFSVDIASGAQKVIGDVGLDKIPRSSLNPAMRLSLSPDGKSLAYGTASSKVNMWLLEGFATKRGWW